MQSLRVLTRPPLANVETLETEIAEVRDRLFELADRARRGIPHHMTAVHVALLSASNELGQAERQLRESALV
jgi:hypothetical protein